MEIHFKQIFNSW